MIKIDWANPPYDHSGRWHKKFDSIFAPGEKITWPQYIAECVMYWRARLIKNHPQITKGKGWSQGLQREVRGLNYQAAAICNFFPHPDDEPLVIYATKKFLREHKVCAIGGFRKNRTKISEAGNEVLNVSQAEKDFILGVNNELRKVLKSRDIFQTIDKEREQVKIPQTFGSVTVKNSKKGINSLKEID